MKWCGTGMKWLEWSDTMEQSEVSQCGLRMVAGISGIWQCGLRHMWIGMTGSGVWMHWSGVETDKCHVKYEANFSELACDERSLSLIKC